MEIKIQHPTIYCIHCAIVWVVVKQSTWKQLSKLQKMPYISSLWYASISRHYHAHCLVWRQIISSPSCASVWNGLDFWLLMNLFKHKLFLLTMPVGIAERNTCFLLIELVASSVPQRFLQPLHLWGHTHLGAALI